MGKHWDKYTNVWTATRPDKYQHDDYAPPHRGLQTVRKDGRNNLVEPRPIRPAFPSSHATSDPGPHGGYQPSFQSSPPQGSPPPPPQPYNPSQYPPPPPTNSQGYDPSQPTGGFQPQPSTYGQPNAYHQANYAAQPQNSAPQGSTQQSPQQYHGYPPQGTSSTVQNQQEPQNAQGYQEDSSNYPYSAQSSSIPYNPGGYGQGSSSQRYSQRPTSHRRGAAGDPYDSAAGDPYDGAAGDPYDGAAGDPYDYTSAGGSLSRTVTATARLCEHGRSTSAICYDCDYDYENNP